MATYKEHQIEGVHSFAKVNENGVNVIQLFESEIRTSDYSLNIDSFSEWDESTAEAFGSAVSKLTAYLGTL